MKKVLHTNLIFRVMCFLVVITSFTCVAFAKYFSNVQKSNIFDIDGISCSVRVNLDANKQDYTFFNTPYLLNGNVMNIPHEIDFTVSNCEILDDGSYSEPSKVDLKYDMVFYIPKELADISVLQISVKDERGDQTAVTPLYVLNKFVQTDNKKMDVLGYFSEKDDSGKDFNYGSLVYGEDETFIGTFGSNYWQWKTADNNKSVIIEEIKLNAYVNYTFPCYSDNPRTASFVQRESPLYLNKLVKDLTFYKIVVSRPEFNLTKDVLQERNYTLRLVTTSEINQTTNPDSEYDKSFVSFSSTLSNTTYSFNYKNQACTVNQNGSEEKWTVATPDKSFEVYIDSFIQKNYPTRINGIFTQMS